MSSERIKIGLGAFLLFAATLAAYWNSFHGAFVYDDLNGILHNASLRRLWPLSRPFSPPAGGYTVSGRPLLNFSFALNYAAGKYNLFGYHLVNFLIHLACGCTLFGVVRRTLQQPPLRASFGRDALPLGWGITVLWLLHPLQTESVTYIVQRAESLDALFYLLTLYCFIRAAERSWRGWAVLSIAACLAGTGVKETICTAPLLALCYDRAYLSSSFREAWRSRRFLYCGFALSWISLAFLVLHNPDRGGTAGFNAGGHGEGYLLVQSGAILHYLHQAAWPTRLAFDYGVLAVSLPHLLLQGFVFCLLLAASIFLYARRPAWGFWAVWFFLILAPSSSLIAVLTEIISEHRLYLPLAGLLVPLWMGIYLLSGRRIVWCMLAVLGLGSVYGVLTFRRNADYRSPLILWTDTLQKSPGSRRAYFNLCQAYYDEGRMPEALAAIEKVPHTPVGAMMIGDILGRMGRPEEALRHFQEAFTLPIVDYGLFYRFGFFLLREGQLTEAEKYLSLYLTLRPYDVPAQEAMGRVLILSGRAAEARAHFTKALWLDPDNDFLRKQVTQCLDRLDPRG